MQKCNRMIHHSLPCSILAPLLSHSHVCSLPRSQRKERGYQYYSRATGRDRGSTSAAPQPRAATARPAVTRAPAQAAAATAGPPQPCAPVQEEVESQPGAPQPSNRGAAAAPGPRPGRSRAPARAAAAQQPRGRRSPGPSARPDGSLAPARAATASLPQPATTAIQHHYCLPLAVPPCAVSCLSKSSSIPGKWNPGSTSNRTGS